MPYVASPSHVPKDGFPPRPIPNSYWITPTLLACEYPYHIPEDGFPRLDRVLVAGVKTFIDLTHPDELTHYEPYLIPRALALGLESPSAIHYHRVTIPDGGVPNRIETLQTILELISENERTGRKTAVHCWGGIGRTGTVVACWLIQSGLAKDAEQALGMIAEEWKHVDNVCYHPTSPQTPEQFTYVRNFKIIELASGGQNLLARKALEGLSDDLAGTPKQTAVLSASSTEWDFGDSSDACNV